MIKPKASVAANATKPKASVAANATVAEGVEPGFVQMINMNPQHSRYMQTDYFTEATANSEVAERDGWQKVDSIAPPLASATSEAEITNHDLSDEGDVAPPPPPSSVEGIDPSEDDVQVGE